MSLEQATRYLQSLGRDYEKAEAARIDLDLFIGSSVFQHLPEDEQGQLRQHLAYLEGEERKLRAKMGTCGAAANRAQEEVTRALDRWNSIDAPPATQAIVAVDPGFEPPVVTVVEVQPHHVTESAHQHTVPVVPPAAVVSGVSEPALPEAPAAPAPPAA